MKKIRFIFSLLIMGITVANIYAPMSSAGFERFPNYYFVETGTFFGDGIRLALRAGFPEIHSVEIDHSTAEREKAKFASYHNVHIWEGDSGKVLWDVIKDIDQPITFWLDGHNSDPDPSIKKNTPLMEELEQIKMHSIKTHTILIDDIHCCNTVLFDFLSKKEIINKILEINPKYKITYVNGGLRNNVLVAYVPR